MLVVKGGNVKILNLYAGIGGNRKLWECHEIVAVELNPDIAKIYSDLFPDDEMIVADAHQYLLEHYKEFDFIWSSPPCQSHSSFRFNRSVKFLGSRPIYPDMKLYEEILFLQGHAECLWLVENVVPYYKPLIPGKLLQRHLLWSNFHIGNGVFDKDNLRTAQIPDLEKLYGYDLSEYKLPNKRQILRNCVSPELGLHILNEAQARTGAAQSTVKQQQLIGED